MILQTLTLYLYILPADVLIGNSLVSLQLVTVILNSILTYAYIHRYSCTHILHLYIQSTNTLHVYVRSPYVHRSCNCVYTYMCIHELTHLTYVCTSTPFSEATHNAYQFL